MYTIETVALRKEFQNHVAVKGLDLKVEAGEVFGFLGPNGAGKTTSIKMFLGLVHPTSGSAKLLGRPVSDERARAKVGFLPEHFRFHEWLTAREFLTLHGQLYHLRADELRRRIQTLLELVNLEPFANQLLRTYSKGMLQRVGLAQALLNRPELVFLDEPTSGLDPVGRRLVRDIIHQLKQEGATVFLNSHLLSEVEITCDRVAFIKQGEVLRLTPLNQIVEGEISLTIRVTGASGEALAGLNQWGKIIDVEGEKIHMTVNQEEFIADINRYLVEQGGQVTLLHPQRVSLEDLFIQIIGTDGGL